MADLDRGGRRTDFLALLLLGLFAVLNFARCLFVDNAVVFHDEYLYKVLADRTVDHDVVFERVLAAPLPNRLYLFVYGLVSDFGANTYIGARFLNVLFWTVGLWFLYRLARLTGLSNGRALAFLGAAALLPLNAFVQYFMPESMFFAFFCLAAWAVLTGVLRNSTTQLVAAGAVMGLMYFIKPHAAPLIAATAFYLLLLPRRLTMLLRFSLGVLLPVGVAKLMTTASPPNLYRLILGSALTTLQGRQELGKELLEVAAGHGLLLLTAFGLSVLVSISVVAPVLRLRDTGRPVSVELQRLALFLIVTSLVLVSMSTIFTVLVGEIGRIHSRYYFFLYPLALLTLFHLPSVRFSPAGKVLGLLVVLAVPGLMAYFGPRYADMLWLSLVSDGPEWGFVFFSDAWCFALLAGMAIAGAWAVLQPRRATLFVVVLSVTSVVSGLYVTQTQKGVFRGRYTTEREAVTVETFLGREPMNTALVIGVNWDVISKFLFFLTTTPSAKIVPAGSNVAEVLSAQPTITTVIALSDSYLFPPGLRCTLEFPGVKVCQR